MVDIIEKFETWPYFFFAQKLKEIYKKKLTFKTRKNILNFTGEETQKIKKIF